MPHLPVRFTKAGLIGLLAYAALPASYAPAQEISHPRIIEDPKLAACINHLGQNMVDDIVKPLLCSKSKSLMWLLPTRKPRSLAIQTWLLVSTCWRGI